MSQCNPSNRSWARVWPRKQFLLRCCLRNHIQLVMNYLLLSSALMTFDPSLGLQSTCMVVLKAVSCSDKSSAVCSNVDTLPSILTSVSSTRAQSGRTGYESTGLKDTGTSKLLQYLLTKCWALSCLVPWE